MTKRVIAVVAALMLLAGAALEVAAHPGNGDSKGAKRQARLNGANEVPGPGDEEGSPGADGLPGKGKAEIRIKKGANRLCFKVKWENIAQPSAGHIHTGTATVAGPVAVTLFSQTVTAGNEAEGCVEGLDPALLQNIKKNPKDYYVNLHNSEFPNGAIRGQLHPSKGKGHDKDKDKDDKDKDDDHDHDNGHGNDDKKAKKPKKR